MNKDKVKRLAIQCGIDVEYYPAGELFSFANAILADGKQEPVAWMWDNDGVNEYTVNADAVAYYTEIYGVVMQPLYTSPQPLEAELVPVGTFRGVFELDVTGDMAMSVIAVGKLPKVGTKLYALGSEE
jgi:hypothetical protein